jgi:hypothetical protein
MGRRKRKPRGAEKRTADDPSLQCGLVARLRTALLLQYLLEVVVYEHLGALGYGGGHLLQARRSHRVLQSRVGWRRWRLEVRRYRQIFVRTHIWGWVSRGVSIAGDQG